MLIARKAMLCCLILLSIQCGHAHAALDTPRLNDLHRDVWTSKDGAPTDIFALTQTADGWLWLATTNGLYRFDGVRFEHFQPRPGETLLDARLARLYAAPDGDLWFGFSTGGGLGVLHSGHVRLHAPPEWRIGPLLQASHSRDGSLWFAAHNGLLRYHAGAWTRIGVEHGVPDGAILAVSVDHADNVWVNSGSRVLVRRAGAAQFEAAGPDRDSTSLWTSPDGRTWIDAGDQFMALAAPQTGSAAPRGRGTPQVSAGWLFDRAGNFWTGDCPAGLCLIHASALAGKQSFRVADMPMDALAGAGNRQGRNRAMFEDAEGNIWVATLTGLERYRPQRIARLPMDPQYSAFVLANDGPDALWVVAKPPGDLWRIAAGAATRVPGEFSYHWLDGDIGRPVLFSSARGIAQRAQGQLQAQPARTVDGRALPPIEARASTFDGKDFWAQDVVHGAVKLVDGRWRTLGTLGFPAGARGLNMDRQGGAWIVNEDEIIDARTTPWRAYGKADGLDIGRVHRIVAQNALLVLGNAGVAVKIGARFYTLRTHRPDLLANALASTESANGDVWINARDGLLRVPAAAWQAWLAQPKGLLRTEVFDSADGFAGALAVQPSPMATTENGKRVWFVDQNGPGSIDSTTIAYNRTAPRVEIVRLHGGGATYFTDDAVRLAAGTRNVSIDYTALSYVMPERLRFRYRLDGLDDNWQDGGTRRTVEYTNLGPGNYRFQVLAANEDGVWGTVPATMAFSIAPLFTQTWWFYGLCAALGLGTLSALYRARVRSVRKHVADRTHERLYERARIARSLHDTYLQSVQGLIYVFHDVAQRLPANDSDQHGLDRALEMADDVLIQGREQVLGLRMEPRGCGTLAESLAEIGHALAEDYPMACSIGSRGEMRALRGHVMEELFSIGREAMLNAFRHSQGTIVELALSYDPRKFTLCIQDDGIGLPPAMLARQGHRAGHFGLPGMRERADSVHATLDIFNRQDGGARIVLTVPGRTAYLHHGARWWPPVRWFS